MKLTDTQKQAVDKMTPGLWYSSYDLGVSISTMEALRRKGIVRERGVGTLGAGFSPRTAIEFRLIDRKPEV